MSTLEIRGLTAAVAGKQILNGIDLTVSSGEVHAVMGPNGAGKSTLSAVIMGKPGYEVLDGTVTLDGVDVLGMAPWQRAATGLHLVMQYPTEVPGVAVDAMLREALAARGSSIDGLDATLLAEAQRIGLDERLLHRALKDAMRLGLRCSQRRRRRRPAKGPASRTAGLDARAAARLPQPHARGPPVRRLAARGHHRVTTGRTRRATLA